MKWVGNIHCNIVCGDENYREGVVDTQLTVQNEKRNKISRSLFEKIYDFSRYRPGSRTISGTESGIFCIMQPYAQ